MTNEPDPTEPLAGLKRFFDKRPRRRSEETCEFCDVELGGEHSHVVNVSTRSLMCVCRACYLLFTHEGSAGGRYRPVPDRYFTVDTGGAAKNQAWEALQIPVGVAFFFFNSSLGRVAAFYPSPAGATESLLPLDTWADIVRVHPFLAELAPDVEALLVRRTRDQAEAFIVPIDACYELVGRIRRHWRGFDGGPEAREQLDEFFSRLRERSRPLITAAEPA
jgi:Family of unknown function (DUF5947)